MSFQIIIVTPAQIRSKSTKLAVEGFARAGVKSSEILLNMDFIASDKVVDEIMDDFKNLKNKVYYEKRKL